MPIQGDKYTFSDKNVSAAPASAGVYALYEDDTLIYIGRAMGDTTTIRSRLQNHKAGREGACTLRATSYSREECSNPATRERELLEEYRRQTGGALPRCNEVMP